MDVFNTFKLKIIDILQKLPLKTDIDLTLLSFQVSLPKEKKFGDISTNVALILGRTLNINALELAQSIADKLLTTEKHIISDIDIVNPGFINITLAPSFWTQTLELILNDKINSELKNLGQKKKINIEYVSANPTGPMHIGHARGAIIGDVLANLYYFFGYSITKEYYINDAGNQIKEVILSVYYSYCKKLNCEIKKTINFYKGSYIDEIAEVLIKKDGDKWLNASEETIISGLNNFVIQYIMNLIREDLNALGVYHDIFTSEKEVASNKRYIQVKQELKTRDLIYTGILSAPKGIREKSKTEEQGPYLLFKTSNFGDDSDRVIEKKDGTRTYFANDIVYHYNKLSRGFDLLINLLGVDHKGYEKRLKSAVAALSNGKVVLNIVFTEIVNLLKDKKPVKMSKRAGNYVTLKEVLDEVSKDVFRIMMISRGNTSTLDFDLATVKEKSEKNPVYYIQYANARITSVFNKAKEIFPDLSEDEIILSDKSLLTHENEILLIKELSTYAKTLITALNNNNVHLIFLLLLNIAKTFHSLWNIGKIDNNFKFIIESNKNLTFARLSLLLSTKKVMTTLFSIIGIERPAHM